MKKLLALLLAGLMLLSLCACDSTNKPSGTYYATQSGSYYSSISFTGNKVTIDYPLTGIIEYAFKMDGKTIVVAISEEDEARWSYDKDTDTITNTFGKVYVKSAPDSGNAPKETGDTALTNSEARKVLTNYINSSPDKLTSELIAESGVKSIKYLEVATIEDGCGMMIHSGDFGFTLKGNFFGYDAYGKLLGQYTFEWAVRVTAESKVELALNGSVKKS